MELASSDKKKLLSLPFYMAKRRELPEPKKGQKEWDFFEEIYGKPWDYHSDVMFDTETKITEFDYEKYIPKQALERLDTNSEEFIRDVRKANLASKTEIEQHKEDQEQFKKMMPMLATLNL